MTISPSQLKAGRTLAALLAENPMLGALQAFNLIRQLAQQVAALHDAGVLHRAIAADAVLLDEAGAVFLIPPRNSKIPPNHGELNDLLPELARLNPSEIPQETEAARARLLEAGVTIDPRQIDLCQLGALFCQMLTGESAQAYRRSPRVKGGVPPELRLLLERALGCDGQERFADVREFLGALNAVAGQFDVPVENAGTATQAVDVPAVNIPASARPASDTTPSFVASANTPADTSVGPGQPPADPSSAGAARGSEAPLPFTRLGHFEIVARIGHGGMGDVYRGYERRLDRTVAIKVLPVDLARQADFVRRFEAEATAAARLIHSNIIQIYFIGDDAGHHFFAMQYVDGESLADLLHRRGKLSVDDALAVVEQALSGLAAAHEQGMVHRDIKPGNILLDTRNRRALLADFGLVKSLESSATGHTATGVVMGTVDYISPEQGRGQTVDGRSDLYSMGVLLYQMVSGRLPFEADNPTALIFQHVYEQPPPLAKTAPHVPAALVSIIERLLAKSPADRHQSAEEVLADLKAFRSGQPLPSRAPAGGRQTTIIRLPAFDDHEPLLPAGLTDLAPPNWWDRTRGRALSLLRRHAPEVLQQLQNTQQQVDGAVSIYERRERELQQLADDAHAVLTELKKQAENQRAGAKAAMDRARAAASPADEFQARDEQAACEHAAAELDRQITEQQEQCEPIRLRLAQAQAKAHELRNQRDILNARLKAAGARARFGTMQKRSWSRGVVAAGIVFVLAGAAIVNWHRTNGLSHPGAQNPVEQKQLTQPGQDAAASQVGQTTTGSVTFKPTVGADGEWIIESGSDVTALAIHPVSQVHYFTFVVGSAVGRIRHFTVGSNGASALSSAVAPSAENVNVLAYSPDGRLLAAGDEGGGIHVLDESLKPVAFLAGHSGAVRSLAFSRDGLQMLSGGQDGTLRLWDVRLEKELKQVAAALNTVFSLDWSPNQEQCLVHTALDETTNLSIWNIGGEGKPVVSFANSKRSERFGRFVDSGRRVVSVDGTATHAWDAKTGELLHTFNTQSAGTFAISRDGRFAVMGEYDNSLTVWDLETEKLIKRLHPTRPIRRVLISNDNQLAISGGIDGTICIWNLAPPPPRHELCRLRLGPAVQAVAFSRDGFYAAAGGKGSFQMWNLDTKSSWGGSSIPSTVSSISFSPDGNNVLLGTGDLQSSENFLQLRDAGLALRPGVQQKVERRFTTHEAVAGTAVVTVDEGRIIGATADGSILVWHARSGEVLSSGTTGTPIHAMAVHRDLALLATSDREVRLWDVGRQEEVGRLAGHTAAVLSVAVCEDGRFAVSGSADRTIRVWNLQKREQVAEFSGHLGAVRAVAISNYGSLVVSGSDDETIGVWDVKSGDRIRWLAGHQGPVLSVALSPDGRRALSGSADGGVRLWTLERE